MITLRVSRLAATLEGTRLFTGASHGCSGAPDGVQHKVHARRLGGQLHSAWR